MQNKTEFTCCPVYLTPNSDSLPAYAVIFYVSYRSCQQPLPTAFTVKQLYRAGPESTTGHPPDKICALSVWLRVLLGKRRLTHLTGRLASRHRAAMSHLPWEERGEEVGSAAACRPRLGRESPRSALHPSVCRCTSDGQEEPSSPTGPQIFSPFIES